MIRNLVSIITPCYNTGNLLPRLLDSILKQVYPYIEMFCIDDGSTDDTHAVIESYKSQFTQKGYVLHYVYQPNSGQSVAINKGLKLVNGEYLVWPDSDDWYSTANAISKMVQVLKDSDDSVGMVRCLAEYVSEETLEINHKISFVGKMELFEDCLFHQNGMWYCSGGYMCRMDDIDQNILKREIYTEKNAGQNWQLMLPLLYGKKCITINEYHYKILERTVSHSRGQYKTYEEQIVKLRTYENTIISTLRRMPNIPNNQMEDYVRDVKKKYLIERYYLSFYFGKSRESSIIETQLWQEFGFSIPWCKKVRLYLSRYFQTSKKLLCND